MTGILTNVYYVFKMCFSIALSLLRKARLSKEVPHARGAKIFFYTISAVMLLLIAELVRKRRLERAYSWLWILIRAYRSLR